MHADGHVVFHGALTPAEVETYRCAMTEHFAHNGAPLRLGYHQHFAAMEQPALAPLIAHPRIRAALDEIFDGAPVVFTGNVNTHQNVMSGWHRDGFTPEMENTGRNGGYDPGKRIYKVAVYLQDHSRDANGLRVFPASHRIDRTTLGMRQLTSSLGDLVIFDTALLHAGWQADPFDRLVQAADGAVGRPAWTRPIKSRYWSLRRRPAKMAVFFTFGGVNATTAQYCQIETSHRRALYGTAALPSALCEQLRASDLLVWDEHCGFGPA